jgi:Bacteriophage lambda head decoration protein D
MTLAVTNHYDNPSYPFIQADSYLPDQLIAGNLHLVTKGIGTITGSAAFLRGTVMGLITASGYYTISKTSAADGSQTPVAILADNIDATSANQTNIGLYLMGEFNDHAIIFDPSWTLTTLYPALQAQHIFLKHPIVAYPDPS